MKNAKLGKGVLLFLGAALFVCAQAALATSVTVGLDKATQGKGNKGTDFRPSIGADFADFVMTAKWGLIADGQTYDDGQNPDQTPGLVYVDDAGTGVWATDWKTGGRHDGDFDPGSKPISGGGPHGQEQLIFTFDSPVSLNSLTVGLVQFKFSDDDPIFFLLLSDNSFITVNETALLPAFTATGGSKSEAGYVDLSKLTVPASNPLISALTVHNADKHFEVNSLTYEMSLDEPIPAVPEPLTLFATLAGIGAIAGYVRRRNALVN